MERISNGPSGEDSSSILTTLNLLLDLKLAENVNLLGPSLSSNNDREAHDSIKSDHELALLKWLQEKRAKENKVLELQRQEKEKESFRLSALEAGQAKETLTPVVENNASENMVLKETVRYSKRTVKRSERMLSLLHGAQLQREKQRTEKMALSKNEGNI